MCGQGRDEYEEDSASEGKGGLCGGGRESARREGMAELRETRLGGGAGGVHSDDTATAATGGAAQDVDGEGVLVKCSPVEATGSATLLLRGR